MPTSPEKFLDRTLATEKDKYAETATDLDEYSTKDKKWRERINEADLEIVNAQNAVKQMEDDPNTQTQIDQIDKEQRHRDGSAGSADTVTEDASEYSDGSYDSAGKVDGYNAESSDASYDSAGEADGNTEATNDAAGHSAGRDEHNRPDNPDAMDQEHGTKHGTGFSYSDPDALAEDKTSTQDDLDRQVQDQTKRFKRLTHPDKKVARKGDHSDDPDDHPFRQSRKDARKGNARTVAEQAPKQSDRSDAHQDTRQRQDKGNAAKQSDTSEDKGSTREQHWRKNSKTGKYEYHAHE
jgi:hypothetical protein